MKCISNYLAVSRYCMVMLITASLSACGSGNDGADLSTSVGTAEQGEAPVLDPANEVAVDPQQTELLEQAGQTSIGGNIDNFLAEDNGDLIPAIFPTETGLDLSFAQSSAALIERLNETLVLPADIDVNFADCGVANAFFVPSGFNGVEASAGGSIVMCHELTQLFMDLYGDRDRAFVTSIFVLMHELGHALVDQLELPVLGIEESYVDGIGTVFVSESGMAEGAVLAGWFFFSQPDTPFFDTHRAGPQRLGDLACWGIGADQALLNDPTISNISQQLIEAGRDCVAEYAQQLNGLTTILGPNIRGGLGDGLNVAQLSDGN